MNREDSILFHLRPFLRRFVLANLCTVMVSFFTAVLPIIIQLVMDQLFVQGKGILPPRAKVIPAWIMKTLHVDAAQMVTVLPLLLFLTFLGQAVFSFFSMYLMKTLGLKIVRNIRDKLYRNLVHQSTEYLSRSKTGDLVSRISNDIDKVKFAVSETLATFIREVLTLIGLLAVIFYIDWEMASISLILVPVAAVPLLSFGKRVKKSGIQAQETIGELSSFLAETVIGNKIVKAYNMEEFEINRFRQINQKNYKVNARIAVLYSLAAPVMDVIGGIVAGALFVFGLRRVTGGTLSAGQFTSFLASLFLMYNPIKRLSQAHNDYQQGKAGFDRVWQVMRVENPIRDRLTAVEIKEMRGEIAFRGVHFAYTPETPVLKDIDFTVRPSERVALVGASGAGKTTILNLILRFYEPQAGDIRIDGRDIRDFQIKSLREHIGLVTQEVFLFNDTVKNNIAYGKRRYGLADVQQAAEIARAAEFIEKMPRGYETVVGERGMLLSAGQRQRLSIARAVIKRPQILIFDEATSSLDSESETLIQEAMAEVMKGRTTIIIAHRLSTIVESDRILVLDQGAIAETGSHQELMQKRGVYFNLYQLQFPEMNISLDK